MLDIEAACLQWTRVQQWTSRLAERQNQSRWLHLLRWMWGRKWTPAWLKRCLHK